MSSTVIWEIFELKNFISKIFVFQKFCSLDGLRKYFNTIFLNTWQKKSEFAAFETTTYGRQLLEKY